MYPMFIAALFTTARTWEQPKCPTTGEWIKKMWYPILFNDGIVVHGMDIPQCI